MPQGQNFSLEFSLLPIANAEQVNSIWEPERGEGAGLESSRTMLASLLGGGPAHLFAGSRQRLWAARPGARAGRSVHGGRPGSGGAVTPGRVWLLTAAQLGLDRHGSPEGQWRASPSDARRRLRKHLRVLTKRAGLRHRASRRRRSLRTLLEMPSPVGRGLRNTVPARSVGGHPWLVASSTCWFDPQP
jgi:hypothetical protein